MATTPTPDKRSIHLMLPADLLERFDARRADRFRVPRLTHIKAALSLAVEADEELIARHLGRY